MDDNLSSIKKLEEISKGTVKPINNVVENKNGKVVIESKKISNKFLKLFISKLEDQGTDPKVIINLIMDLDEGIENGSINEKSFDNLSKVGGNND